MVNTYKIEDHTIEFKDGSSTLNPWSFEYCSKIGLGLMCTSDLTPYMRVDGEKIYHLRRHYGKHHDLKDALENSAVVVTWKDVQTIFEELFEDFVGNFSEMKVRLDEAKREEDEFKKLSPEEKKQRIAEWRAKRIAEIERLKQEEKKQD
jgi:hypothetical protein